MVTLEGLSVPCLPFPSAQGERHLLTSQGGVAWGCLLDSWGSSRLKEHTRTEGLVRPFILQVSAERERSLPTTSQEESQTLAVPSASATQIPGSAQDRECPLTPLHSDPGRLPHRGLASKPSQGSLLGVEVKALLQPIREATGFLSKEDLRGDGNHFRDSVFSSVMWGR